MNWLCFNNRSDLAASDWKEQQPALGCSFYAFVMSYSLFAWPPCLHQEDSLSVLMNPTISFNHSGVGSTLPGWRRAGLMNHRADPSIRAASTRLLSLSQPLHESLMCSADSVAVRLWDSRNSSSLAHTHPSFVSAQTFPVIDNAVIFSLGGRKSEARRGPC